MKNHEKINYLEIPATDIARAKTFFSALFGWSFTDYGNDYSAFSGAGIDGGFVRSSQTARSDSGGVLIVFYSTDLEDTRKRILQLGGTIIRPEFAFPGGRRFHFGDPNGNEYAVWSDRE